MSVGCFIKKKKATRFISPKWIILNQPLEEESDNSETNHDAENWSSGPNINQNNRYDTSQILTTALNVRMAHGPSTLWGRSLGSPQKFSIIFRDD